MRPNIYHFWKKLVDLAPDRYGRGFCYYWEHLLLSLPKKLGGITIMKITKIALSAVSALGILALSATPAFAATSTDTVSTAVVGAGDTVTAAFPAAQTVKLGGGAPTIDASIFGLGQSATTAADNLITLDDATGTAAGWSTTIQATPLTEVTPSGGFASGTSAIVLPYGTVNFVAPSSIVGLQSQASADTPVIDAPATPTAIDNGNTLQWASAVKGTGTGMWGSQWATTTPVLEFMVSPISKVADSTNYPGAPTPYSTTITVTMVEN